MVLHLVDVVDVRLVDLDDGHFVVEGVGGDDGHRLDNALDDYEGLSVRIVVCRRFDDVVRSRDPRFFRFRAREKRRSELKVAQNQNNLKMW